MLVTIFIFLIGTASALEPECPIIRKDLSYKTFVDKVLTLEPGSFEFEDAFASMIYVEGRDKGLEILFKKGTPKIKIKVVDTIGTCRLDGYDKLLAEAATSPNTDLRSKAGWSYCSFLNGHYADQIEKLIHDPDPMIREDAAACLPHRRHTSAKVLDSFLIDSNPRVQLRIANALVENGDRCCHQLGIDHLLSADSGIRREAIKLLGAYGDKDDLPALKAIENSTAPSDKFMKWAAKKAAWRIQLTNSTGDERQNLFMSALTSQDEEQCSNVFREYARTKRTEDLIWLKEGRKKYGKAACKGYIDRYFERIGVDLTNG